MSWEQPYLSIVLLPLARKEDYNASLNPWLQGEAQTNLHGNVVQSLAPCQQGDL